MGFGAPEIALITETWAAVQALPAQTVGGLLFKHIFEQADVSAMFSFGRVPGFDPSPDAVAANTGVQDHGAKVVATVTVAIGMLTDLDNLVPVLKDLGAKHAKYGVLAAHYPVVGGAFLKTLSIVSTPHLELRTRLPMGFLPFSSRSRRLSPRVDRAWVASTHPRWPPPTPQCGVSLKKQCLLVRRRPRKRQSMEITCPRLHPRGRRRWLQHNFPQMIGTPTPIPRRELRLRLLDAPARSTVITTVHDRSVKSSREPSVFSSIVPCFSDRSFEVTKSYFLMTLSAERGPLCPLSSRLLSFPFWLLRAISCNPALGMLLHFLTFSFRRDVVARVLQGARARPSTSTARDAQRVQKVHGRAQDPCTFAIRLACQSSDALRSRP